MEATGDTRIQIEPKTRAGRFICDTQEHFYWMQKHLERYKEVADDNGQVLEVIANYIPKVS